jgi:hypothetical protein
MMVHRRPRVIHGGLNSMTDVAQLNQGRFYWVLVRSSTKDPEWQPARFNGVAGDTAGAKWDFVGFNRDVGHYFVEIVDIGPELTESPPVILTPGMDGVHPGPRSCRL